MLSSKDLMARAGISRATLNNYIGLGLLPRPIVQRSDDGKRPPRLGFFPEESLETLSRIAALKQSGTPMAEIVRVLAGTQPTDAQPAEITKPIATPAPLPATLPRLTFEAFEHPAFMVNKRFELEWWNEAAERALLDLPSAPPSDIRARNLFAILLASRPLRAAAGGKDFLSFTLSISKGIMSKTLALGNLSSLGPASDTLDRLYEQVDSLPPKGIVDADIDLAAEGQSERWHTVYATFFREGVLFVLSPNSESSSLLSWLARRDLVIRDILRRRRPYLTPLAVLVADLQESTKICAELPPDEYFLLINRVLNAMEPNLRRFHATHGKHPGDGIVFYFFPQPDTHYVMNAILCAQRMKQTMTEVSREWRRRKGWLNELRLNIGIDAGEEWFGTYQTSTHVEFTVLGDTVNNATRLSTFARDGSIWAAKNLLSKLPATEMSKVRFGIRRTTLDGGSVLVPSTYARISNLLDTSSRRADDFRDIAMSPVTEIFDVPNGETPPSGP